MFIQTEATPNPMVLKFLPGRDVMGDRPPADFPNREAAQASPLATALFAIDEVESVFLGRDFLTVAKKEGEWQHLKPALLAAVMDFFTSGAEIILTNELAPSSSPDKDKSKDGDETETVKMIKQILDARIRPAVAQDGGDIVFHGFDDGVVSLHLRGACAGCPSATMTLKNGVENLLKHYLPEVTEVRAVL